MALRTNVVVGTLAGPWLYNDYLNLLTGAMQDQLITVQGTIQSKALGNAPGAPTLAVNSGGSVDVGAHTYAITFVSPNGETVAGTTAAATTTSGNQTVALSSIPTGPAGTTKRNIYRSKVGTTSPLYLVTTLNDNSTTSINDTVADSTLPATQPPTHSTFGGCLQILNSSGTQKAAIYNDGAVSFDAGSIFSNGSGALTASAFHGPADSANSVAPGNISAGTLAGGVTVPEAQVTSGYPAGNVGAGTLASGVHLTSLYSDSGNLTSDGSGGVTAAGNVNANLHIVKAGVTVSGKAAIFTGGCGNAFWAGCSINFSAGQLTNAPTSISFTSDGDASTPYGYSGSAGATKLNTYGFNFHVISNTSAATGASFSFTTSGNCLRAVDLEAGTFDQHCDHCDSLHQNRPFSDLEVHFNPAVPEKARIPGNFSMSFTCPVCGTTESYDTGLTSEDEKDEAPEGITTRGNNAILIRQLLQGLKLPMAD